MAEPLAVTGRPTRGGLAPTPTSRRAREGSTIPNVSHVDDGRLGTGLQAESAVAESLVNAEGTGVGGETAKTPCLSCSVRSRIPVRRGDPRRAADRGARRVFVDGSRGSFITTRVVLSARHPSGCSSRWQRKCCAGTGSRRSRNFLKVLLLQGFSGRCDVRATQVVGWARVGCGGAEVGARRMEDERSGSGVSVRPLASQSRHVDASMASKSLVKAIWTPGNVLACGLHGHFAWRASEAVFERATSKNGRKRKKP